MEISNSYVHSDANEIMNRLDTGEEDNYEKRPTRFIQPSLNEIKSLISCKSEYKNKFKEFSGEIDLKINGALSRKWKRRYITIKDKVLNIYKTAQNRYPIISLNFDTVSLDISIVSNSYICITPKHFCKSLLIQPVTLVFLEDLCISMHSNLTRSIGSNVVLAQLCKHSRKFWRRSYITLSQLFEIGENGDVILFKSKTFGSMAVRVASNSDYDHVGLLIKGKKGKLYIYEALGAGGVQINNLEYFLDNNWQLLYKRVSLRKLNYERSEEFTKNFTKICSKWLGRPYKISAKKLLRRVSIEAGETNFFCSELVAAVYKKVGLLPQGLSSCQYWPSTFSQKNKLELLNNAYLSEEMRVIFYQ